MPDIFDEAPAATQPTSAGDIFDQPTPAPAKDIFDYPDPTPPQQLGNTPFRQNQIQNRMQQQRNAVISRGGGAQPTEPPAQTAWRARQAAAVSPEHLQQVAQAGSSIPNLPLNAQAQQAEQNLELYKQANPIVGNVINAGMAGRQALTGMAENISEALGGTRPENFEAANTLQSPSAGGISGAVGDIGGQLGAVSATGPVAPFTALTAGIGGVKSKWLQEQAAGQTVTPGEMAKDIAVTYAQNAAPALITAPLLLRGGGEIPETTNFPKPENAPIQENAPVPQLKGDIFDEPTPAPEAPILKRLQPADQQMVQQMAERMNAVPRTATAAGEKPVESLNTEGATFESPPQRRAGDLAPEDQQRITELEQRLNAVERNAPTPQRRISDISPEMNKMLTEQGKFQSPEEATAQTPAQIAAARAQNALAKPPQFTEGAATPTEPGEIGYRNREAPEHQPQPLPLSPAGNLPVEEMENLAAQQNPEIVPAFKGMAPAPEEHVQDLAEEARQEQQRQTQNAAAIAKHNRPFDFLRSWWEGRKTATAANAAYRTKTAPAFAQLDELRDQAPNPNTPEGRALITQHEQTGKGFGDELDKTFNDLTAEAIENAKSAGTDVDKYSPWWAKRLAKPREGTSGATGRRNLAGNENYLKSRTKLTTEDWYGSLDKHDLVPMYDNAADQQAAGIGEVHRSAEMGHQIKAMLPNGDAIQGKPGDKPPPGWDRAGEFIGSHGENIFIPHGVAAAWRNIIDSSVGDVGKVWNSIKRFRYALDNMTAKRAVAGYAGDALQSRSPNKLQNLQTAFKVSQHPEILNQPGMEDVKAEYEKAARNGGFTDNEWQVGPKQRGGLVDTLGKIVTTVPRVSAKYVVEPLRGASMLNLADEINQHSDWTPEQAKAYQRSGIDTINRMLGGEMEPTGLPPAIDKIVRTVFPYVKWHTAGIRQGIGAIPELAQGKIGPNTRGFLGAVVWHAIANATAQAVSTKWNTGHVIAPTLKDMMLGYRTGEKNPDGSEKRASLVDSFFPLVSAGAQVAHGEWDKAVESYLDPEISRMAESYVGRTESGQKLSPSQRLTHLLGGAFFTQGITNDQGNFSAGAAVSKFFNPDRELPKTAERSSAQNYLNDVMGQNIRKESPEQEAKWQRWSQLADTPEDFEKNKEQLYNEMSNDPSLSAGDIRNAWKRWSSPGGFERQIASREVGPDDLLHAWNLASDDEKAQMRPLLEARMGHVSVDRIPDDEKNSWRKLMGALAER